MRFMLCAAAAALLAAPAAAKDRPPTPTEQAAIEKVLRAQGFTAWDEIELEDGVLQRQPYWEVDDARGADGKAFDLRLEPGTLKVLRREPD